jgi:signal transduction histidine kinase
MNENVTAAAKKESEDMDEKWMITKKGALTCYVSSFVVILSCYILFCNLLLHPWDSTYLLLLGILIMFAIGAAIASLQLTCKPLDATQLQAEELTQQIILANEQARQFECAKEQFLLNINHELRTPLTVVYGYFELLQLIFEQNGSLEYEKHATYMQNALSCCEDLCLIVNTILQNIDIDYGQTPIQSQACRVETTIREICASLDITQAERQRLCLHVVPDIMLYANVQSLHKILYQLLNNAFKYTPQGSPIIINAEPYTLAKKQICISILDVGPGIPIHEQVHIFEQFVRLPRNIAGNVRGTGLGLFICKQLVESMQGKIWVESAGIDGQGSNFCFTLPMVISPDQEASPPEDAPSYA